MSRKYFYAGTWSKNNGQVVFSGIVETELSTHEEVFKFIRSEAEKEAGTTVIITSFNQLPNEVQTEKEFPQIATLMCPNCGKYSEHKSAKASLFVCPFCEHEYQVTLGLGQK